MGARVLSFLRRRVTRDWSSQELAEFYRVEAALVQSGLRVSSDRGVSDEGDPWFVFCRTDDEEVIIHFARIAGEYVICAPEYGENVTGTDFRALVCALVERHPVLRPPERLGSNVRLHPATLLFVLVASILLKSTHTADAATNTAAAASSGEAVRTQARAAPGSALADNSNHDAHQDFAIMATVGYIAAPTAMGLVAAAVVAPHSAMPADNAGLSVSATVPDVSTQMPHHTVHGAIADAVLPPVVLPAEDGSHVVATWWSATETHALASTPMDPPQLTAHTPIQPIQIEPSSAHFSLAEPTLPLHVANVAATDALAALQGGGSISIAGEVPPNLAHALHTATHVPATESASQQSGTADMASHSTVANPVPALPDSGTTATPAQAVAPASSGVSATGDYVTVPATNSVDHSGVSLSVVLADMNSFAHDVAQPAVIVVSTQVIMYDAAAVSHMPSQVAAEAFDFPDGSSVSFVGLPAELPHVHLHA